MQLQAYHNGALNWILYQATEHFIAEDGFSTYEASSGDIHLRDCFRDVFFLLIPPSAVSFYLSVLFPSALAAPAFLPSPAHPAQTHRSGCLPNLTWDSDYALRGGSLDFDNLYSDEQRDVSPCFTASPILNIPPPFPLVRNTTLRTQQGTPACPSFTPLTRRGTHSGRQSPLPIGYSSPGTRSPARGSSPRASPHPTDAPTIHVKQKIFLWKEPNYLLVPFIVPITSFVAQSSPYFYYLNLSPSAMSNKHSMRQFFFQKLVSKRKERKIELSHRNTPFQPWQIQDKELARREQQSSVHSLYVHLDLVILCSQLVSFASTEVARHQRLKQPVLAKPNTVGDAARPSTTPTPSQFTSTDDPVLGDLVKTRIELDGTGRDVADETQLLDWAVALREVKAKLKGLGDGPDDALKHTYQHSFGTMGQNGLNDIVLQRMKVEQEAKELAADQRGKSLLSVGDGDEDMSVDFGGKKMTTEDLFEDAKLLQVEDKKKRTVIRPLHSVSASEVAEILIDDTARTVIHGSDDSSKGDRKKCLSAPFLPINAGAFWVLFDSEIVSPQLIWTKDTRASLREGVEQLMITHQQHSLDEVKKLPPPEDAFSDETKPERLDGKKTRMLLPYPRAISKFSQLIFPIRASDPLDLFAGPVLTSPDESQIQHGSFALVSAPPLIFNPTKETEAEITHTLFSTVSQMHVEVDGILIDQLIQEYEPILWLPTKTMNAKQQLKETLGDDDTCINLASKLYGLEDPDRLARQALVRISKEMRSILVLTQTIVSNGLPEEETKIDPVTLRNSLWFLTPIDDGDTEPSLYALSVVLLILRLLLTLVRLYPSTRKLVDVDTLFSLIGSVTMLIESATAKSDVPLSLPFNPSTQHSTQFSASLLSSKPKLFTILLQATKILTASFSLMHTVSLTDPTRLQFDRTTSELLVRSFLLIPFLSVVFPTSFGFFPPQHVACRTPSIVVPPKQTAKIIKRKNSTAQMPLSPPSTRNSPAAFQLQIKSEQISEQSPMLGSLLVHPISFHSASILIHTLSSYTPLFHRNPCFPASIGRRPLPLDKEVKKHTEFKKAFSLSSQMDRLNTTILDPNWEGMTAAQIEEMTNAHMQFFRRVSKKIPSSSIAFFTSLFEAFQEELAEFLDHRTRILNEKIMLEQIISSLTPLEHTHNFVSPVFAPPPTESSELTPAIGNRLSARIGMSSLNLQQDTPSVYSKLLESPHTNKFPDSKANIGDGCPFCDQLMMFDREDRSAIIQFTRRSDEFFQEVNNLLASGRSKAGLEQWLGPSEDSEQAGISVIVSVEDRLASTPSYTDKMPLFDTCNNTRSPFTHYVDITMVDGLERTVMLEDTETELDSGKETAKTATGGERLYEEDDEFRENEEDVVFPLHSDTFDTQAERDHPDDGDAPKEPAGESAMNRLKTLHRRMSSIQLNPRPSLAPNGTTKSRLQIDITNSQSIEVEPLTSQLGTLPNNSETLLTPVSMESAQSWFSETDHGFSPRLPSGAPAAFLASDTNSPQAPDSPRRSGSHSGRPPLSPSAMSRGSPSPRPPYSESPFAAGGDFTMNDHGFFSNTSVVGKEWGQAPGDFRGGHLLSLFAAYPLNIIRPNVDVWTNAAFHRAICNQFMENSEADRQHTPLPLARIQFFLEQADVKSLVHFLCSIMQQAIMATSSSLVMYETLSNGDHMHSIQPVVLQSIARCLLIPCHHIQSSISRLLPNIFLIPLPSQRFSEILFDCAQTAGVGHFILSTLEYSQLTPDASALVKLAMVLHLRDSYRTRSTNTLKQASIFAYPEIVTTGTPTPSACLAFSLNADGADLHALLSLIPPNNDSCLFSLLPPSLIALIFSCPSQPSQIDALSEQELTLLDPPTTFPTSTILPSPLRAMLSVHTHGVGALFHVINSVRIRKKTPSNSTPLFEGIWTRQSQDILHSALSLLFTELYDTLNIHPTSSFLALPSPQILRDFCYFDRSPIDHRADDGDEDQSNAGSQSAEHTLTPAIIRLSSHIPTFNPLTPSLPIPHPPLCLLPYPSSVIGFIPNAPGFQPSSVNQLYLRLGNDSFFAPMPCPLFFQPFLSIPPPPLNDTGTVFQLRFPEWPMFAKPSPLRQESTSLQSSFTHSHTHTFFLQQTTFPILTFINSSKFNEITLLVPPFSSINACSSTVAEHHASPIGFFSPKSNSGHGHFDDDVRSTHAAFAPSPDPFARVVSILLFMSNMCEQILLNEDLSQPQQLPFIVQRQSRRTERFPSSIPTSNIPVAVAILNCFTTFLIANPGIPFRIPDNSQISLFNLSFLLHVLQLLLVHFEITANETGVSTLPLDKKMSFYRGITTPFLPSLLPALLRYLYALLAVSLMPVEDGVVTSGTFLIQPCQNNSFANLLDVFVEGDGITLIHRALVVIILPLLSSIIGFTNGTATDSKLKTKTTNLFTNSFMSGIGECMHSVFSLFLMSFTTLAQKQKDAALGNLTTIRPKPAPSSNSGFEGPPSSAAGWKSSVDQPKLEQPVYLSQWTHVVQQMKREKNEAEESADGEAPFVLLAEGEETLFRLPNLLEPREPHQTPSALSTPQKQIHDGTEFSENESDELNTPKSDHQLLSNPFKTDSTQKQTHQRPSQLRIGEGDEPEQTVLSSPIPEAESPSGTIPTFTEKKQRVLSLFVKVIVNTITVLASALSTSLSAASTERSDVSHATALLLSLPENYLEEKESQLATGKKAKDDTTKEKPFLDPFLLYILHLTQTTLIAVFNEAFHSTQFTLTSSSMKRQNTMVFTKSLLENIRKAMNSRSTESLEGVDGLDELDGEMEAIASSVSSSSLIYTLALEANVIPALLMLVLYCPCSLPIPDYPPIPVIPGFPNPLPDSISSILFYLSSLTVSPTPSLITFESMKLLFFLLKCNKNAIERAFAHLHLPSKFDVPTIPPLLLKQLVSSPALFYTWRAAQDETAIFNDQLSVGEVKERDDPFRPPSDSKETGRLVSMRGMQVQTDHLNQYSQWRRRQRVRSDGAGETEDDQQNIPKTNLSTRDAQIQRAQMILESTGQIDLVGKKKTNESLLYSEQSLEELGWSEQAQRQLCSELHAVVEFGGKKKRKELIKSGKRKEDKSKANEKDVNRLTDAILDRRWVEKVKLQIFIRMLAERKGQNPSQGTVVPPGSKKTRKVVFRI
ncbi:hypothetical protein BLNAU_735 [Blattamonas nauphoetae]|uniref:Uncharacterized protein n=1 Tax=Blattamonas nauphoetae TaxID=2049346 RepID=A0ABQ9YKX0_9EUKA|nr:hypothetical protein BLNAU_735 [Blattamonas nauphoetae]